VAELTGLDTHQIEQVAMLYGRSKAGFIGWTMGVNHSTQGAETVNAINNLALLTGNIGRAGAAPFSITGQCNAMGTREAGFASDLPAIASSSPPRIGPELAALWNIAPERIPQTRGLAYPDIIEAAVAKRVRALWIIATNPMVSFPNHDVLKQALETVEFLVVQDAFHPTPTSELADLILPAAMWGEKEGTYTNSERRVSKVNRVVAPPAEARPTSRSFSTSQHASGCARICSQAGRDRATRSKSGSACRRDALCDYSAMTYEQIEAEGGMQWGGERLYADGEFATPDGRAKLFAIEWEPFPDQPGREYPFILNTGRTVEHWHTGTKTRAVSILAGMSPRAWLEMNPRDAQHLKLKPHDQVSVISKRSRLDQVELRVTEIIAPGQVFMPFHFVETNSNRVTQSAFDPISRETELQAVCGKSGAVGRFGDEARSDTVHSRHSLHRGDAENAEKTQEKRDRVSESMDEE
jgi:assimilatory nitrate reductase catalytic subunit